MSSLSNPRIIIVEVIVKKQNFFFIEYCCNLVNFELRKLVKVVSCRLRKKVVLCMCAMCMSN